MSKNENNDFMEDISSSTQKSAFEIAIGEPVEVYGSFIYRHLAGFIKAIAYILAICNIIAGFGVAAFIFKAKLAYIALSFAAVLFFSLLAAIVFFIVYGIGHAIQQNNDILKKLK